MTEGYGVMLFLKIGKFDLDTLYISFLCDFVRTKSCAFEMALSNIHKYVQLEKGIFLLFQNTYYLYIN